MTLDEARAELKYAASVYGRHLEKVENLLHSDTDFGRQVIANCDDADRELQRAAVRYTAALVGPSRCVAVSAGVITPLATLIDSLTEDIK